MGNMMYAYVSHPDTAPNINKPPSFDPLLGFENGRKERTVKATREELDQARIPLEKRDYCVDDFMAFMKCRDSNFPFVLSKCSHERHVYEECEYQDFVLRMKEYEREKRLLERQKRIQQKDAAEELGD
ncbi:NADH dehydrogenase [ubiquinone] 1 beta subcomplex subunit 7-like [Haliotis rubra]|uniref:NADH dehydrogenase [ubiquinone] 1 beta subcomplex subunit 7-like n=1 Tax=Haliotis rubra TaxID=36100 RepID=UPI001EE5530E|nr:NADH dehydrogenase [ubiquinone] 1 beta subcomplex subunit 7-like [Haliotis rubra]